MDRSQSWQSANDIRKDLFEYSNLPYPDDSFTLAPPKSIAEYRARTGEIKNPGVFDVCKEDIGVFISGRGRYVKNRIIKPGLPVEYIPEDDLNIKKKIRQVSGLGFANEIIEKVFDEKNTDMDFEEMSPGIKLHSSKIPNLKLHDNISPFVNYVSETRKEDKKANEMQ